MIFGLSPLFLFATVAAAIGAAYFFRHRSKVVVVPAVTVWLRIGHPVRVRSLGTILAALASLAVQLLVIGLIVLALWNPFPQPPVVGRMAVVIDLSAKMQTREGNSSRFDTAIANAQQMLAELPGDIQVTLVTVSTRAAVLHRTPTSPQVALADLATLRPTDVNGDLEAAIRAASFLSADPTAMAVVFSDFAGSDAKALRAAWNGPAKLDLRQVGTSQPDIAVEDTWQRERRGGQQIGISIAQHGIGVRTIPVVLRAGGRDIERQAIKVADGASQTCEFITALTPPTPYEVRVETGDALACDDIAYGTVRQRARPVTLITLGNPSLVAALRAEAAVDLKVTQPDQFSGTKDDETLIIDETCDGQLALNANFATLPRRGGTLLIGTLGPAISTAQRTFVYNPRPTHWAASHPILNGVTADLVRFDRTIVPDPAIQIRPILSAGDVPLIGETGNDFDRVVYWLFRIGDTDLASRISFPVLLWNTLDYLHGQKDEATSATTGQAINVTINGHIATRAVGPDGTGVPIRQAGEIAQAFDADHAGIYALDDPASTRIGVSYISQRPLQPLPFVDRASPAGAATINNWWRPSWQMLAVAVVGLMVIEVILYRTNVLRIGT